MSRAPSTTRAKGRREPQRDPPLRSRLCQGFADPPVSDEPSQKRAAGGESGELCGERKKCFSGLRLQGNTRQDFGSRYYVYPASLSVRIVKHVPGLKAVQFVLGAENLTRPVCSYLMAFTFPLPRPCLMRRRGVWGPLPSARFGVSVAHSLVRHFFVASVMHANVSCMRNSHTRCSSILSVRWVL